MNSGSLLNIYVSYWSLQNSHAFRKKYIIIFLLEVFIQITTKILGTHMDWWVPSNNSISPQVPWHTGWESPMLVKVKKDRGTWRLLALLAKWKCQPALSQDFRKAFENISQDKWKWDKHKALRKIYFWCIY